MWRPRREPPRWPRDIDGTVSERMAGDGLRVLALGMRRWSALPDDVSPETVERDLTLLGLVGLVDPPRQEAREAVELCKSAGIVPVMITGDHPMTARAIARRLGILEEGGNALTGTELAHYPRRSSGRRSSTSVFMPAWPRSRNSPSSRRCRTAARS